MKSALLKIPEKIEELILNHTKDLETAWANSDNSLAISFPVKVGIDKYGKQVCDVGISFVMEKCQDSTVFEWNDKQLNLAMLDGVKVKGTGAKP